MPAKPDVIKVAEISIVATAQAPEHAKKQRGTSWFSGGSSLMQGSIKYADNWD
jgi:hypothetical protein